MRFQACCRRACDAAALKQRHAKPTRTAAARVAPGRSADSAPAASSVIGPGVPEPITRSSIRTTGLSSRVVLVMNASSARLEVRRAAASSSAPRCPASRPSLEQERSGDALQQPRLRRRRQRHPLAHQEEVRLRALGQLAAVVAHQRFFARRARCASCIAMRVVQQVVRLDDRVHRAGMVAQDRHQRDRDAFADRRVAAARRAA